LRSLSLPEPFDLRLALFGHGRHRRDADARRFHTVVPWRSGAVDLEVRQVALWMDLTAPWQGKAAR